MTIELANRLIEFRKKHNLSQEQLADKLHLSRQTISKWERSEASPDTDNLIELAKLYNIPIDDLLNCKKDVDKVVDDAKKTSPVSYTSDNETYVSKDEEDFLNSKNESNKTGEDSKTDESSKESKDGDSSDVHIDLAGIHINAKSDDGDKVHIGSDGIHVKSSGGDEVHIDTSGVHINDKKYDGKWTFNYQNEEKYNLVQAIISSLSVVLLITAYITIGLVFSDNSWGWIGFWPILFLIPFFPSLYEAIHKRRFSKFGIVFLVLSIYLTLGMAWGYWHPWWLLFLIIPAYYALFEPIDKYIGHNKKKDFIDADVTVEDEDNDETDEDKDD